MFCKLSARSSRSHAKSPIGQLADHHCRRVHYSCRRVDRKPVGFTTSRAETVGVQTDAKTKPWPQNRYQSFILKIETETETGFWRPERRRPQYWSPVQSGLESISSGGPTPESRRSATLLSKLALNKNIISPHRCT